MLTIIVGVIKALEYLAKSNGIQRTRELAAKHASLALAAIDSLPANDNVDVQRSRMALKEMTYKVTDKTKWRWSS